MSSKTVLSRLVLGGTLASAASSSGAIVVFDISPDVTRSDFTYSFGGVGVNSIDFSNGTFVSGSVSSPQFFAIGTDYGIVKWKHPTNYRVSAIRTGASELALLAAGQFIGNALDFNYYDLSSTNPDPGAGTRYIGLTFNDGGAKHYGWLELSYTPLVSGFRDYTFTRFAFENVAAVPIFSGQTSAVPEASTLGLVGGLFGLVAAAHVRRRKAKQAAASDKFLALAAGEKLN